MQLEDFKEIMEIQKKKDTQRKWTIKWKLVMETCDDAGICGVRTRQLLHETIVSSTTRAIRNHRILPGYYLGFPHLAEI